MKTIFDLLELVYQKKFDEAHELFYDDQFRLSREKNQKFREHFQAAGREVLRILFKSLKTDEWSEFVRVFRLLKMVSAAFSVDVKIDDSSLLRLAQSLPRLERENRDLFDFTTRSLFVLDLQARVRSVFTEYDRLIKFSKRPEGFRALLQFYRREQDGIGDLYRTAARARAYTQGRIAKAASILFREVADFVENHVLESPIEISFTSKLDLPLSEREILRPLRGRTIIEVDSDLLDQIKEKDFSFKEAESARKRIGPAYELFERKGALLFSFRLFDSNVELSSVRIVSPLKRVRLDRALNIAEFRPKASALASAWLINHGFNRIKKDFRIQARSAEGDWGLILALSDAPLSEGKSRKVVDETIKKFGIEGLEKLLTSAPERARKRLLSVLSDEERLQIVMRTRKERKSRRLL